MFSTIKKYGPRRVIKDIRYFHNDGASWLVAVLLTFDASLLFWWSEKEDTFFVRYALKALEGQEIVYLHPDGSSAAAAAILPIERVTDEQNDTWAHDHIEG